MNKKKLTVDEIWSVNVKTSNNGYKLPYSKQQHSKAEGCTADAMRYWNECLPKAKQYTKKEHTAAVGCTADAMRYWNLVFPNAEQYMESEIISNNL